MGCQASEGSGGTPSPSLCMDVGIKGGTCEVESAFFLTSSELEMEVMEESPTGYTGYLCRVHRGSDSEGWDQIFAPLCSSWSVLSKASFSVFCFSHLQVRMVINSSLIRFSED